VYPFEQEHPFNKEVLSNEDEIRLITPIKGVISSQPVVWKEFEIVLDRFVRYVMIDFASLFQFIKTLRC